MSAALVYDPVPGEPHPAVPCPPPRLGSRLWLYTNFDCNLACDYCCAESAPRPRLGARRLTLRTTTRAVEEFVGLGGREVLLTGGEPFLHPELDLLVAAVDRWVPEPIVILTNAMIFVRGRRRGLLGRLDPRRVVLQVSLDSGDRVLHDRHRGAGSFERALEGMRLARSLGFRVKVAATIDAADATHEQGLHDLLAAEQVPIEDRLVRRVARMGFAEQGVDLTNAQLHPELTLSEDGAWWHPVGVADPQMQVATTPLPVVTSLAVVRAVLRAREQDPTASLEQFRCT